jgi:chemotaxis signal transduction protein
MINVNGNQPADPALDKVWDAALLETENTSRHALVFSIDSHDFAIAAEFIEQILELPGITEVPGAGATLLGLAEHAGRPVPVVDISPLLDAQQLGDAAPSGVDSFRHGLLLNHNGVRVMLAIETVIVLKKVARDSDSPTPLNEFAECIGVVQDEHTVISGGSVDSSHERRVVVLDVPRLLVAVQLSAMGLVS